MISNITNTPVTMEINGKKFLVRQLGFPELLRTIEPIIKSQYLKEIRDSANVFTNAKDRSQFIRESIREQPNGVELNTLCQQYLQTLDGIRVILELALNKNPGITAQDIDNILCSDTDVTMIIDHSLGVSSDKKSEAGADSVPLVETVSPTV